MVQLQIKRGNENQFVFNTSPDESIKHLVENICFIYNGRLKVVRICSEIEELVKHGVMLPPEILGLTDDQVEELKLVDVWAEKCTPSGGYDFNKDPIGRRNGRQPKPKMQELLLKAIEDVKKMIDKKWVNTNTPVTLKTIEEALSILKGAITIVYPMQLPPHDPIRMEFTNTEDLSGSQASKEIIEPAKAQLWFAGHQMLPEKLLQDYIGKNDKTKTIVKLTQHGEGPPARELAFSEQMKRMMMAEAYKRQEELKVSKQYLNVFYFNKIFNLWI